MKRDPRRSPVLAAALALSLALLGACASYRATPADQALAEAVTKRLRAVPSLAPPDLWHVQAHEGVVYLYGLVVTEFEKRSAEAFAQEAAGSARVVNLITVDNGAR
jgi:osmotically-inducible protein OsmY